MSAPKFGRLQKASALLPLALLSTAVTASLAGAGATTAAAQDDSRTLPDGTSIPTQAIEAPASVSKPGVTAPGITGNTKTIVANASTMGIPAAALAAYQRAETVINTADKSCNIPWQLIAAIGRVESDHGRVNGNSLNSEGLATPGIFGIALDGSNNTARIADSDAGLYDSDAKFDRAVGPMQFIPSTWRVVGVDADSDGERNPQDIDDAALASAVYLCSGDDDLSTEAGQRASVFRYNHSQSYVDLVLSIMNAYLEGDFTTIPNNTTVAGYIVPEPPSYNPGTDNGLSDDTPSDTSFDSDDDGYVPVDDTGDDTGDTTPDPGPTDEGPTDEGPIDTDDGPKVSVDPDDNNVPDTNTPIDEPVENLVDGLLGPLTKAVAAVQCPAEALLRYPLNLQAQKDWKERCLSSYGL
jgi:membrane-bound lytic murein transglycosylase B